MEQVKSWLTSRTVWALLVAMSPILATVVGFDVNATLSEIVTVVGIVAGIYFRITASAKLK